jgi:hypothetical protein
LRIAQYLLGCVLIIGFSGFGFFFMSAVEIDTRYTYVAAASFAIAIFCAGPMVMFHIWHLPVVISDDGMGVLSFGRVRTFIAWNDVARIESIRYFEASRASYCELYYVYGATGTRIRFDDGLEQLRDLLDQINRYVRQRGIEIVRYDRGTDTLKGVRNSSANPTDRKRVLREGVRSRLLEL